MPRRRTSNRPLKRRIKLETARDIQDEMGKRYRAMQHGDALRSDVSKDVYVLDKLRAGLPEMAENGSGNGYSIPGFTILSMPTNHFLTGEQITALKRGEPIVDVRKCTPLLLESEPTSPALLAPELDRESGVAGGRDAPQ